MHHRLLGKNTRSICDQISVDLTARALRVDAWAGRLYAVVTGFKTSITPIRPPESAKLAWSPAVSISCVLFALVGRGSQFVNSASSIPCLVLRAKCSPAYAHHLESLSLHASVVRRFPNTPAPRLSAAAGEKTRIEQVLEMTKAG
jgi:hypothetical protein